MSNKEILEGYLNADKPFEVAAHTKLGGHMEFMILERLMFEDNAKSVCVRKEGVIIYEVEINETK